jgi:hypothetical protein
MSSEYDAAHSNSNSNPTNHNANLTNHNNANPSIKLYQFYKWLVSNPLTNQKIFVWIGIILTTLSLCGLLIYISFNFDSIGKWLQLIADRINGMGTIG